MSASKAWTLAGLKAALVTAGPQAAAEDLVNLPEEVSHGPSHLGVIAHTAAFQHGGAWLDALLRGLDANRSLLDDLLAQNLPEVEYVRPEGTYLAWLVCRRLGIESPSVAGTGLASDVAGPARYFLDQARVALSSGHVFGTGGSGHVRLNFATSTAILTEAVTRMGSAAARRST